MDRREFLKVTGAGALTLFLSGCGINARRRGSKTRRRVQREEIENRSSLRQPA